MSHEYKVRRASFPEQLVNVPLVVANRCRRGACRAPIEVMRLVLLPAREVFCVEDEKGIVFATFTSEKPALELCAQWLRGDRHGV